MMYICVYKKLSNLPGLKAMVQNKKKVLEMYAATKKKGPFSILVMLMVHWGGKNGKCCFDVCKNQDKKISTRCYYEQSRHLLLLLFQKKGWGVNWDISQKNKEPTYDGLPLNE